MYVLKQKNSNWWIADWQGDPGRTLKIENARKFKTIQGARISKGYNTNRYKHIRKMDLEIVEIKE